MGEGLYLVQLARYGYVQRAATPLEALALALIEQTDVELYLEGRGRPEEDGDGD